MIRFDMSEYMEKHSVAKLVGAPPGYVGYDEAANWLSASAIHTHSFCFLDEVEKIHRCYAQRVPLQVLDDGRWPMAKSTILGFQDTIIIMTSMKLAKLKPVGFGQRVAAPIPGASSSPEFMNRFYGGIIEFQALSKDNLLQIVNLMLDDVNQRLTTNDIHLDIFTEKVKKIEESLTWAMIQVGLATAPPFRTISKMLLLTLSRKISEKEKLKAIMTSNGRFS